MKAVAADLSEAVHDYQKLWGWYLALGIAMIVAGAYAIYAQSTATEASVIALGAIICLAGVVEVVVAFMTRNAGHLLLLLLVGILYIVVGAMLVQHPDAGALSITLLLAALFVFGGIYRFIAALWLQFPQWGWVAASGVVSAVLGVLLWMQWPNSASWFIGFAVGINLIIAGITWSAYALNLKKVNV